MSEQGLPSDAEKLSGGGVSEGVSHWASPGVNSVHRTPDGHRVICEGHFCPSAQCPLCVLCKKDLAPRLLLLLPTHGSFLRTQLTGGSFQARLFCLFLSLDQEACCLSGDPTLTPVQKDRHSACLKVPRGEEEIRLGQVSQAPWSRKRIHQ